MNPQDQRNDRGYGRGGYGRDNQNRQTPEERAMNDAKTFFNSLTFKNTWITNEIDKDFTIYAEKMGKFMAEKKLTNSKIRSIYGEMKRIQMGQFDKEKASFYLLRPKVAYALGRDKTNTGLCAFKLLFDRCSDMVADSKTFLNFALMFEAVLAYHKSYGGKD